MVTTMPPRSNGRPDRFSARSVTAVADPATCPGCSAVTLTGATRRTSISTPCRISRGIPVFTTAAVLIATEGVPAGSVLGGPTDRLPVGGGTADEPAGAGPVADVVGVAPDADGERELTAAELPPVQPASAGPTARATAAPAARRHHQVGIGGQLLGGGVWSGDVPGMAGGAGRRTPPAAPALLPAMLTAGGGRAPPSPRSRGCRSGRRPPRRPGG